MKHVCELLQARAAAAPDKLAIVEPGGATVTFRELCDRAAAFSGGLDAWGVAHHARIVLLVPMGVDLYVALLGIAWGGRTAVLVDPSADRTRIDGALARIDVHGLVGSRKAHLLRLVMPALRSGVQIARGGLWPFARGFPQGPPGGLRSPPAGEPLLITFTTGTTGAPKAIGRSHAFLLAQHDVLAGHMGLGPADVDLPTLPVFLLNSLAAGATCVLPPGDLRDVSRLDPAAVAARIRACGVTTTSGSPAWLDRLAGWLIERGETLHLRAVFVGGARVGPDTLTRMIRAFPGARVEVVYGSTEAEPIASIAAVEALEAQGDGACVGRPVAGVTVRLSDAVDGVGEVQVHGAHVNRGYYRDPAADAENKLREGDVVWHRTGDAARLDAHGRLWLMGRVGDAIGGRWPFPVEARAEALPGVTRAALVDVDGAVLAYAGAAPEAEVAAATGVRAVRLSEIAVDPRHRAKVDRDAVVRAIRGAPPPIRGAPPRS